MLRVRQDLWNRKDVRGWREGVPPVLRASLLGLLLLLSAVTLAPSLYGAEGDKEYKAGQEAEARKDYDEAYRQYQLAHDADPNNPRFLIAVSKARLMAGAVHVDRGWKLQEQGNLQEALAEFEQAYAIDPASAAARQGIDQTTALIDARQAGETPEPGLLEEALGPPELMPLSRAPINLHMTNEGKVVFETIGKLAGINVLFDPDYSQTARITVDLTNVVLEEALDQAALLTKTFWKAVTRNTILVVPDTAVKRREQEQQVIKTFYLSNTITPQELTEVVTAIRSLLETRRIQQINSMNAIIIRDTPDKVAIAEKIIRDVDKAKPEVVVDVAVLEVRRDKKRDLGLAPGGPGLTVPLVFTPRSGTAAGGDGASGGTSIPLNRLGNVSSGDYSITLPGATLQAVLSDSSTRILQRPQVRASDGMKATLRIGDRVPIATGSFQPGIGGVGVNPLVNTQFQYTDVGVNLDITPKVHANKEITLKVRVEISAVTSEVDIGGISQPVIGQRVIEHDIRLREGEVNVLGGILQSQTTDTVSGIPGLSQIPLLRYLFSNVSKSIAEDEVLIVLVPRTVRVPELSPLNQRALDIGTEGDIRLRTPRTTPEESVPPEPAAPAAPAVAPAARLRLAEPDPTPAAGETFEVGVELESDREAFSIPLELSYDGRKLRLVRAASGGFLGQDGQPVAVVERIGDGLQGSVVTLSRPPGSGGIAGSGLLARLTFQAMAPGTTTLGITPTGAQGPTREFLPIEGTQATVTVR